MQCLLGPCPSSTLQEPPLPNSLASSEIFARVFPNSLRTHDHSRCLSDPPGPPALAWWGSVAEAVTWHSVHACRQAAGWEPQSEEGGEEAVGTPGQRPTRSPVAVEVLQLSLHRAADAAAVAAVQPVAYHAQAVMPLLSVEGKVLHLGGDALPALGHRHGSVAVLLPAGDGGSQPDARLTQPRGDLRSGGGPSGSLGSGEPFPGHATFHLLQEGLPRTHRETCTPPGETGEAERGTARKYLAESGGDSNTSSGMELISSWGGGGVGDTERGGVRSHCPDTVPQSTTRGQEKEGQADSLGGK